MKNARWLPLALFIVLAAAAAGIGGIATSTSVDTWYVGLNKPAWNPPRWVFGPVWTLLYGMVAVATWRVWKNVDVKTARRTVALYSAQLSLNALWSILFFGLRNPGLALVDIVVLWVLLVIILARYRRTDRLAAALWAPYVAWVTFAAALNAAIWRLNA